MTIGPPPPTPLLRSSCADVAARGISRDVTWRMTWTTPAVLPGCTLCLPQGTSLVQQTRSWHFQLITPTCGCPVSMRAHYRRVHISSARHGPAPWLPWGPRIEPLQTFFCFALSDVDINPTFCSFVSKWIVHGVKSLLIYFMEHCSLSTWDAVQTHYILVHKVKKLRVFLCY